MHNTKNYAFTLIELIVTVAIATILALIGSPAYSKYRVRAKVSYMYESANAAKLIVTGDYFNNDYSFTSSNYTAGSQPFVTSSGAVANIAVTNGIVTVTGNANELGGRNIIMIFTPSVTNNDITWNCAIGSNFLSFAPQNCQNPL